jgi:hypothetical protein
MPQGGEVPANTFGSSSCFVMVVTTTQVLQLAGGLQQVAQGN